MSTRGIFRRKVVLTVTVIRNGGQEKQLAHTLDVTESSARLGGLSSAFEPGEIIELQRGANRARFQVVWVGVPGTSCERQAGVRGLEPGNGIWSEEVPEDEMDTPVDIASLRNSPPVVRSRTPAETTCTVMQQTRDHKGTPLPCMDTMPATVLIKICRTLANNIDEWKGSPSAAEMEELREAVDHLQQRLSPPHHAEILEYLNTTMQRSGMA